MEALRVVLFWEVEVLGDSILVVVVSSKLMEGAAASLAVAEADFDLIYLEGAGLVSKVCHRHHHQMRL